MQQMAARIEMEPKGKCVQKKKYKNTNEFTSEIWYQTEPPGVG